MVHEWHSSQSFELLDPRLLEAVPPPAPCSLLSAECVSRAVVPGLPDRALLYRVRGRVLEVDFLLASSA